MTPKCADFQLEISSGILKRELTVCVGLANVKMLADRYFMEKKLINLRVLTFIST